MAAPDSRNFKVIIRLKPGSGDQSKDGPSAILSLDTKSIEIPWDQKRNVPDGTYLSVLLGQSKRFASELVLFSKIEWISPCIPTCLT